MPLGTTQREKQALKEAMSKGFEDGFKKISRQQRASEERTAATLEKSLKEVQDTQNTLIETQQEEQKKFLNGIKQSLAVPLGNLSTAMMQSSKEAGRIIARETQDVLGNEIVGLAQDVRSVFSPLVHGVGNIFKSQPKLQAGGQVLGEGTAYLHKAEVVSPAPHVKFAESMMIKQYELLEDLNKNILKEINNPDISKDITVSIVKQFPKDSIVLDEKRNYMLAQMAPEMGFFRRILEKIWGLSKIIEIFRRRAAKRADALQEESRIALLGISDNIFNLTVLTENIQKILLRGMREDQKRYRLDLKRDFRDERKKFKKPTGLLTKIVVGGLGLALGYFSEGLKYSGKIMYNMLKTFIPKWIIEIFKPLKKLKIVSWIGNIFSKEGKFGKILKWFGSFGKIFKTGILGKALSFGKKLFWPIQVLIGLFNVFKGVGLGKNMKDKIIGGLAGLTKTIIDFFLGIPEMAINAILRLFGKDPIDITPSIEQIYNFFKKDIPKAFYKVKAILYEAFVITPQEIFYNVIDKFKEFFTVSIPNFFDSLITGFKLVFSKKGLHDLLLASPFLNNKVGRYIVGKLFGNMSAAEKDYNKVQADLKDRIYKRKLEFNLIKAEHLEKIRLLRENNKKELDEKLKLYGRSGSTGSFKQTNIEKGVATIHKGIGALSQLFESGSKGSKAIGFDRMGGKSYGKYQISTKTGAMSEFFKFLEKSKNIEVLETLKNAGKVGSKKFDEAWKTLAGSGKLQKLEDEFAKTQYFDKAKNKIKDLLNIDISKRSKALQEALFSTSIQHGVSGAVNIFKNLGITSETSDRDIIKKLYDARKTKFKGSTKQVIESIKNRLEKEKEKALSMLGTEENRTATLEKAKEAVAAKTNMVANIASSQRDKIIESVEGMTGKFSSFVKSNANIPENANLSPITDGPQGTEVPDEIEAFGILLMNRVWI